MQTYTAITIAQPYASAIRSEIIRKRYETRDHATSKRGPVAILASKNRDWIPGADPYVLESVQDNMPFGAIVATANLIGCIKMTPEFIASVPEVERRAGFYEVGRYAWVLEDVKPVDPPVPAAGKPWLFNIELEVH